VDPYFSLWSFSDTLYSDTVRNWTGRPNTLTGTVTADGTTFLFMGNNPTNLPVIEQTSLTIYPLRTVYTFENHALRLNVTFMTPFFPDDAALAASPVGFIFVSVSLKRCESFSVTLEAFSDMTVSEPRSRVISGTSHRSAYIGNACQNPLSESGDNVAINWGYLHLAHPTAAITGRKSLTAHTELSEDVFVLAYDDIHSIRFMGKTLDAYYTTRFPSFSEMLKNAVVTAYLCLEKAQKTDNAIRSEAMKLSCEYADLVSLSYRQCFAAHKAVSFNGQLLFVSKECFSNGCAQTLDVTYPSMPLFLCFAPEYVTGMLRGIFRFAESDMWKFEYAPHDCGQYPLLDRQVYGLLDNGTYDPAYQMAVEECGNAIICTAAAVFFGADRSFADEKRSLLTGWARYLADNGYFPSEQLCTDDFAGHVDKNCNLSLKTIVALALFGRLYGDDEYTALARDMAKRWEKDADDGDHTRLSFDAPGTWSLKYNIVWDRIFDLGLFCDETYAKECAFYTAKAYRYGTPLDSRETYTKLDWLAWTSVMGDESYARSVYECIYHMTNETLSRVPMTDWYYTDTACMKGFQNRSVVGALFINLLKSKLYGKVR